ncbi:MAG: carboxypeptidase regulatory-like domain-containing protein [Armatimonadota bacterium]
MKLLSLCITMLCISGIACAGEDLSVNGKVLDSDGNPVSGINVHAVLMWFDQPNNGWNRKASHKAKTVTDQDGSFSFAKLPPLKTNSMYFLIAYKPGEHLGWLDRSGNLSSTEWSERPVSDGIHKIDVMRTTPFTGRVVDDSGKGLHKAKVSLTRMLKPEFGNISDVELKNILKIKAVETNSDGYFSLPDIPEGAKVQLDVSKQGYSVSTEQGYIDLDSTIPMSPAGDIIGRVIDEYRNPMAGVMVTLGGDPQDARNQTTTKQDGAYTLKDYLPGNYIISVRMDDKIIEMINVTVSAGKITQAPDLIAKDGIEIKGRVVDVDSGEPVNNARIIVTGAPQYPFWRFIGKPTGNDGIFKVRALPGDVKLSYFHGNLLYDPAEDPMTLSIDKNRIDNILIKLKKKSVITGTVVDEDGKPVAQANIRLFLEPRLNPDGQVFTGSDGKFVIPYSDIPVVGG